MRQEAKAQGISLNSKPLRLGEDRKRKRTQEEIKELRALEKKRTTRKTRIECTPNQMDSETNPVRTSGFIVYLIP